MRESGECRVSSGVRDSTLRLLPCSAVAPRELSRRACATSELPIAPDNPKLIAMALVFQVDNQGHAHPKLRCDACGGIIEDPSGGIALWDRQSETPGAVLEPTFHCRGCLAKAGGAPPRSIPLDLFIVYLVNNIHLTPGVLEGAGRSLNV